LDLKRSVQIQIDSTAQEVVQGDIKRQRYDEHLSLFHSVSAGAELDEKRSLYLQKSSCACAQRGNAE
jgi:hypothetical protein